MVTVEWGLTAKGGQYSGGEGTTRSESPQAGMEPGWATSPLLFSAVQQDYSNATPCPPGVQLSCETSCWWPPGPGDDPTDGAARPAVVQRGSEPERATRRASPTLLWVCIRGGGRLSEKP